MKSKTMDDRSQAARPGELVVSHSLYAKYVGKNFIDQNLYLACSYLPWFTRALPWIGPKVYRWAQISDFFQHGCLIPAKVLDAENCLVAAFTSLTASGDHITPVVKIYREPLGNITSTQVKDGMRFAATSVYSRTPESMSQGCWSDFFPFVVDCLVDDPLACENAKQRLEQLSWDSLDMALAELGDVRDPGLHHVELANITDIGYG